MSVKVFIILVTVAAGVILLAATVIACKVLSLVLKGAKKGRERIRRIIKKQTVEKLLANSIECTGKRRGLATCVCTAALAYTTTA